MKKLILIVIGVSVLCLPGCDSAAEKKEKEKKEVSKRLSGSVKPLPKRGDPMPGGL